MADSTPTKKKTYKASKVSDLVKKFIADINSDYIDKLFTLKSHSDEFMCNNTVRNRTVPGQYMFKLLTNGQTALIGDNGRKYEFLVEFDEEDFSYGIYYGCKIIFDSESVAHLSKWKKNKWVIKEVNEVAAEWEKLSGTICRILNNSFVGYNFNNRLLPTDNVSDDTYWPFWFRLETSEDVYEIAGLAVKIIRNVYQAHLSGNLSEYIEREEKQEKKRGPQRKEKKSINFRYTESAYQEVLNDLLFGQYQENAANMFVHFIDFLIKEGQIVEHPLYEKCWKLQQLTPSEFSILIHCFFTKITKNNNSTPIWKICEQLFLSKSNEPLDNLASLYIKAKERGGNVKKEKVSTSNAFVERWYNEYCLLNSNK